MKLSKRVLGIQPSATLTISAKAKAMNSAGHNVINFGAGEPDFDTPANIKEAAKKAIDEGFTKYTAVSGIPELKKSVCEKFKRDNNLVYEENQIIISNGAKQSLMNICMAVLEEGDEVIIIKPYWITYDEQVRMCDATPILAESEDSKIKAELVAQKISNKTKMIILNSPCNPSGTIIEETELRKIADLCVKHDLICVSDEPYEKIIFDSHKHISIASLNKEIYERTITVNAVSKTYSMTGWRIGYCAGPIDIIKAMNNLQSHSTSGPCSISQKAAVEAINGSQDSVEKMKQKFEERRNYVVERLNNIKGITCPKPEGTFYVFPNISGTGLSSFKFCEKILDEEMLALVPGEPFGDDECVRMSFSTSMENLKEGLDRIKRFCEKLGDNNE